MPRHDRKLQSRISRNLAEYNRWKTASTSHYDWLDHHAVNPRWSCACFSPTVIPVDDYVHVTHVVYACGPHVCMAEIPLVDRLRASPACWKNFFDARSSGRYSNTTIIKPPFKETTSGIRCMAVSALPKCFLRSEPPDSQKQPLFAVAISNGVEIAVGIICRQGTEITQQYISLNLMSVEAPAVSLSMLACHDRLIVVGDDKRVFLPVLWEIFPYTLDPGAVGLDPYSSFEDSDAHDVPITAVCTIYDCPEDGDESSENDRVLVVSADEQGEIRIWDMMHKGKLAKFQASIVPIRTVAAAPIDKGLIAVGGGPFKNKSDVRSIAVYDIHHFLDEMQDDRFSKDRTETLSCTSFQFPVTSSCCTALDWHPHKSDFLLSGTDRGDVLVWRFPAWRAIEGSKISRMAPIFKHEGHRTAIEKCVWHPAVGQDIVLSLSDLVLSKDAFGSNAPAASSASSSSSSGSASASASVAAFDVSSIPGDSVYMEHMSAVQIWRSKQRLI